MPWRNVIQGMLDGCIQPQSDSMRETSVSDMSILERQQARLKWQTQQQLLLQQQQNGSAFDNTSCYVHDSGFPLPVVSDPQQLTGEEDRTWMDFMQYSLMAVADPPVNLGFMGGANVCSSQPETGGAMVEVSVSGNSSCKKRKADSTNGTPKGNREMQQTTAAGPNGAEKRIKSEQDGTLMKPKQESGQKPTSSGSITTQSSKEACTADSTKQKPGKGSDVVQKTDYIHVRARRGQATDSHSLAERVRREKISERMKYLQELVPGCNKITGKAGMLDEIINYVQSLQKQVEFLSMKLAAVNPLFDTSPDCFPMTKEKACSNGIPLGIGPVPPQLLESAYFSTNPLLQMAACGLDTALNLQESAAVLNGAVTVTQPPPGVFSNTPFNPLSLSPGWNVDLQCLLNGDFQQAKASLYTSFAGVGTNNLQMHM